MMPCYNARSSVSVALASLIAQTYQDWECIVIDDGSTDNSASAIRAIKDPRIRYFRSDRNCGRGHAQALALEHSRGEFLANLDADDWLYPEKLESQINFLLDNPEVACIGVGLALAEPYNQIVAVQLVPKTKIFPPSRHPSLRFACGAAMVRTPLAKLTGFDPTFRRAQDHKFFHQLLRNRAYAVLPRIAYVYTFKKGTSAAVTLEGLAYNLRYYREQLRESPLFAGSRSILCLAKLGTYRCINRLGFWDKFQQSRRRSPSLVEQDDFVRALALVLPGALSE